MAKRKSSATVSVKQIIKGFPVGTGYEKLLSEKGVDLSLVRFSEASWKEGKVEGLLLDNASRWMAIRRKGVYWFHPTYGKSNHDGPSDGEIVCLLWRDKSVYRLAISLVADHARAVMKGGENGFSVELQTDYGTEVDVEAPMVLLGMGRDPHQLMGEAMKALRDALGTFRLREEKVEPEFADYFGWCTWNAFYVDVSERKVLNGLKSFEKGGVQPRFLILDDGWQSMEGYKQTSFKPNEKFPKGLRPLVEKAKSEFEVKIFGVWHALQGYWQGVDPESELGQEYETSVLKGKYGPFADGNWGDVFDTDWRSLVTPKDVHRFYHDFYYYLRQEGVDMVKVDNQAQLEYYCVDKLPVEKVHRAYQQAFQGAAQTHFGGASIHCMCNINDIAFNNNAGTVWRNSDDFYPKKPAAKQAMHVYHNAINNFFTRTFSFPDWDMFQTYHYSGEYHAAARAISGGPIYVSDEPGKQNFDLIRKLVYSDGVAVRSPQPAQPGKDCLLIDTQREASFLKVANRNGDLGVLGIFHALEKGEDQDTADAVTDKYGPSDIPYFEGEQFAVYSYQKGSLEVLEKREKVACELQELGFDLLTMAPIEEGVAPIGLTSKMNPSATVAHYGWVAEDLYEATFYEGGDLLFYSDRRPKGIYLDGERIKFGYSKKTCELQVKTPVKKLVMLEIQY